MSLPDIARDAGAESVPTRRLAEFAASLRGDGLPTDIKTVLGELFLDYIRARFGGSAGATVLFRPERRDPARVAFLNATYAATSMPTTRMSEPCSIRDRSFSRRRSPLTCSPRDLASSLGGIDSKR